MTEAPTPDSSADNTRPAWAQAVYDRQLRHLARLADIGMEISTAIEAEAKAVNAGDGSTVTPEALKAFELYPRIARAVRLTVMLEDKLIRHLLGEDKVEPKAGQTTSNPGPVTEVRRIIVAHPDRADRLIGESGDRPDRERPDVILADLPFDEAIEIIDLDLQSAETADTADSAAPSSRPHSPAGGRGPRGGGWGL